MGSGRVGYFPTDEKGRENTSPLSYNEICDRLCPDYLAMGMTWHDYWYGDPEMVIAFRKAHELKRKQTNTKLWLQGMYIYEALLDASPAFRDLVKNPKVTPYPKEPYALSDTEAEKREKEKEEAQDKDTQAKFLAWVKKANRIISDKSKKGEQGNGG